MTNAGADIIVPHMGTTVKGAIGAQTSMSLDEAAKLVQSMRDAAIKIRPDILVLCHGGPIAEPEDAQFIFDHTEGIAGFFGASSIERLSVEPAIEDQTRRFKDLSPKTGRSR
jgi:predicted TIM-barrel enzyme